jgi:hypothetical protein
MYSAWIERIAPTVYATHHTPIALTIHPPHSPYTHHTHHTPTALTSPFWACAALATKACSTLLGMLKLRVGMICPVACLALLVTRPRNRPVQSTSMPPLWPRYTEAVLCSSTTCVN